MRLPKFEHLEPASLAEACALLSQHREKAAVVAGGTDLLVRLKQRLLQVQYLVNLKKIPELRRVAVDGQALRIGALATLRDLQASPAVRELSPLLAEAASLVAAPQLQNMGTLGGNLCLDPRCWYYNQSEQWRKALEVCIKAGGKTCHMAKGSRRCYALYCGDMAPALIALGATVRLVRADGQRVVPLAEFYVDDGQKPNVLAADELLAEVIVPIKPGQQGAYVKFRHRESIDFPVVGVAAAVLKRDGVCQELGMAITGVASAPILAARSQATLQGQKPSRELIEKAAELAFRQVRPVPKMECSPAYRKHLVRVLAEDVLTRATGL